MAAHNRYRMRLLHSCIAARFCLIICNILSSTWQKSRCSAWVSLLTHYRVCDPCLPTWTGELAAWLVSHVEFATKFSVHKNLNRTSFVLMKWVGMCSLVSLCCSILIAAACTSLPFCFTSLTASRYSKILSLSVEAKSPWKCSFVSARPFTVYIRHTPKGVGSAFSGKQTQLRHW